MNTVSQMCSAPLDLISMLEKMPGYENMTDAEMQIMKHMNVQKLDLNQAKPTQPYGTLKRPGGNRGSVMPGAKVNAPDAAKMFREVGLFENNFLNQLLSLNKNNSCAYPYLYLQHKVVFSITINNQRNSKDGHRVFP